MQVEAFRYRFPFVEPFTTGSGTFTHREGILFTLRDEKGDTQALAEAAPLPGFSRESIEEVLEYLNHHGTDLVHFVEEQATRDKPASAERLTSLPSLQFAVDTLVADFQAKRRKLPLRDFLFDRSRKKIPLNATLPAGDPENTASKAENFWKEGFRTFKVKVGKNFQLERAIIARLRRDYPESKLRIDANRSWEIEEAAENLHKLAAYRIEFCEEPLQYATFETLRKLEEASEIPLALDESLHDDRDSSEWITQHIGQVIIFKPMVFGSFQKLFETFRLAVTHEYRTVFTSSMESGIGRVMTANLASGLGTSPFAHGLATGSHFKMDLWNDRAYINNGYFSMPDGFGLGERHGPQIEDLALKSLDL